MNSKQQKIRCACGLSQKMPWCDGGHQDETWFCEAKVVASFNRAIYASAGLYNLGKRLAWRFDGQSLRFGKRAQGKKLLIVDDGSQLQQTCDALDDFDFDDVLYIGVDFDPSAIAKTLNIPNYYHVKGSLTDSFVQLEQLLDYWFEHGALPANIDTDAENKQQLQNIFISHAVADEVLLIPAVEFIRKLTSSKVFLCFDSIQSGGKWRREIDTALKQTDLFVVVISQDSVKSTYCAYEIGFAQALGKPIKLISLDGTLPPPFVSHIHCIDLRREIAAKPWLGEDSALKLHLLGLL